MACPGIAVAKSFAGNESADARMTGARAWNGADSGDERSMIASRRLEFTHICASAAQEAANVNGPTIGRVCSDRQGVQSRTREGLDVQVGQLSVMKSNQKILIVEDDADLCLGYKVLLGAHSYETVFAGDCGTALRAISEHQPDLIILDLGLPGTDGFSVLEEFNMYTLLVPVVVISARMPEGNSERSTTAGARAYLQKPWDDKELLETIGRLLLENEPALSTE
jgi:CheY-like chemotaxis protein